MIVTQVFAEDISQMELGFSESFHRCCPPFVHAQTDPVGWGSDRGFYGLRADRSWWWTVAGGPAAPEFDGYHSLLPEDG